MVTSTTTSSHGIAVALIARVRLYRDGLVATLGRYADLTIAGTASSRSEALSLLARARPDVAVVDMALDDPHQLLCDLHQQTPATQLLAFGIEEQAQLVIDCAQAGAAGFVTLDASVEELVHAIRRIAAGELMCSPRIAAALFQRIAVAPQPPRRGRDVLTMREQQVLALLRRGLTNKEIASTLNISEATVKNHLHHLFEKLNVASRAQAVVRAQLESSGAVSA